MSVLNFIKIRGFDGNPGSDAGEYFEIFQGIGYSSVEPGDISISVDMPLTRTPISSDPELAEGIWQGQNEKLESESDYCNQLQKLFKKKETRINGIMDKFLDVVEELIGNWLAYLVSGWVFFQTGSLEVGWLAGFLTEVGSEWGFDALRSLLTRGNQLLEGIQAENEKLLEIEKSRENYEYRELALARHREDIKVVLEQIRMAEKAIEINTQLEMKALLERLTDLAFRDDTIDLGDAKFHARGKVVNF